jgi:hypothetical protein
MIMTKTTRAEEEIAEMAKMKRAVPKIANRS